MKKTFAIVFPGQGSQSVGMLSDLAQTYPQIKQTFTQASDVLGYDLWQLTQEGPAEKLDQTMYTQPALLAASYAVWQILPAEVINKTAYLAGHSLGEYTALVCAQALAFTDAIKIVAARGKFMQEAVAPGEGAMAAIIGLDDAAVTAICKTAVAAHEVLSPANFNSIGQVVIAGHTRAVDAAMQLAKEQGAKLVVKIPVSVPSHCALMQPAAKQLAALLEQITFHAPMIPVINNVDASLYPGSSNDLAEDRHRAKDCHLSKDHPPAEECHPERSEGSPTTAIKAGLIAQLSQPVRWVETIQFSIAHGITQILECGPGKVLTGLNKRIDKNLQLYTTTDLANLQTLASV